MNFTIRIEIFRRYIVSILCKKVSTNGKKLFSALYILHADAINNTTKFISSSTINQADAFRTLTHTQTTEQEN